MVYIKELLSDEEDALLGEIHDRVCEELQELIEDYLMAVKEEVDTANILQEIGLIYKSINFSLKLPNDRQAKLDAVIDEEIKKRDMPTGMFI